MLDQSSKFHSSEVFILFLLSKCHLLLPSLPLTTLTHRESFSFHFHIQARQIICLGGIIVILISIQVTLLLYYALGIAVEQLVPPLSEEQC